MVQVAIVHDWMCGIKLLIYIVSGNTLFWCADESVVFFRKAKFLQMCILVLLQAKVVLQNVAFNVQGYHLLAVLASLIARVFLCVYNLLR